MLPLEAKRLLALERHFGQIEPTALKTPTGSSGLARLHLRGPSHFSFRLTLTTSCRARAAGGLARIASDAGSMIQRTEHGAAEIASNSSYAAAAARSTLGLWLIARAGERKYLLAAAHSTMRFISSRW